MRGAERTFAAIADCWPEAPIYTLLYDEAGTERRFARPDGAHLLPAAPGNPPEGLPARCSPSTRAPPPHLPVEDHDSSSRAAARSPTGCASRAGRAARLLLPLARSATPGTSGRGRSAEVAARRCGRCSRGVLRRHRALDRRPPGGSTTTSPTRRSPASGSRASGGATRSIVHPPVDVSASSSASPRTTCSFVGELVRHKRAEVAIEAAVRGGPGDQGRGHGPRARAPRRRATAAAAEFLGRVADGELAGSTPSAAALVVPNVEEFGIAAVEAQAAGRPVVAVDARRRPRDRRSTAPPACSCRAATSTRSPRRCETTSAASIPRGIRAHAYRLLHRGLPAPLQDRGGAPFGARPPRGCLTGAYDGNEGGPSGRDSSSAAFGPL